MISHVYLSSESDPAGNLFVGNWVSREVWGEAGRLDNFCTMAVFDGSSLIAGVVYHNVYPDTGVAEITGAAISPHWLQPRILGAMYHMPFGILGSQLVVQRVRGSNHHMLQIMRRFPHDEHVIPRLEGRDEAGHIFTLTKEAWETSALAKRSARR